MQTFLMLTTKRRLAINSRFRNAFSCSTYRRIFGIQLKSRDNLIVNVRETLRTTLGCHHYSQFKSSVEGEGLVLDDFP